MVELRRYLRTPIDVALEFATKGKTERASGRARDLSLGGMYIQTDTPLAFGEQLIVHVVLPGYKAPLALPAVVRWSRAGEGMGVQFGLLGARETHAITELTSKAP